MYLNMPDFGVTNLSVGNNIADAIHKGEEILSNLISDRLIKKISLPEPYGDVNVFQSHMVVRLTTHIPDLRDACKVIVSELDKREFFWDAMVSTVKSAISDKLDDLDEDVDTLLIDDIAEVIVERIGGWS